MTDDVASLQQIVNDMSCDKPEAPTLLDYFAGKALGGFMAAPSDAFNGPEEGQLYEDWADEVADCCYSLAEAMIRERDRRMRK